MKLMSCALKKLKLVRQEEHNAKIKANHEFTIMLGNAVKAAGVSVVLNDQFVRDVAFDNDLFVIGSRNNISNVILFGSALRLGPQSESNMISNLRVAP